MRHGFRTTSCSTCSERNRRFADRGLAGTRRALREDARIIPFYVPCAGHAATPYASRASRAVAVPRSQARSRARGLPSRPLRHRDLVDLLAFRRGRAESHARRACDARSSADLRSARERRRVRRRAAHRRPAPRDGLAMVVEGNRHREKLRAGADRAHRARRRISHRHARRGAAHRGRSRGAAAAAARPDDRGGAAAARGRAGAVRAFPAATDGDDSAARARAARRSRRRMPRSASRSRRTRSSISTRASAASAATPPMSSS